jgi:hypothetical protein
MWQVQYVVDWSFEWLQVLIQAEADANLIFALLCLWAATGRGGCWCAGTTALMHLLLILI